MVRSIKNQYRGINAHLHSLFQAEGTWSSFHTRHIVHLADALKAQLLPMGYTAELEASLQIRRFDRTIFSPRADVLIAETGLPQRSPGAAAAARPETMTVAELLGDEELSDVPYRAVVIYRRESGLGRRSEPVAWIELLSPSNKGSSDDALAYREKRMDLLVSGLVFVEIDYLHETPPTFAKFPAYPGTGGQQPGAAHPYRILVIDPRPVFEQGGVQHVPFGVDMPLPLIDIPLNQGDRLNFDLNTPYARTYEAALYGLELVDYRQLPVNFERYTPADQSRIVSRMVHVLEAARRGDNLEQPPQPVETLPLEEGLKRLELYQDTP